MKQIHRGGAWVRKNVERLPLASFVSATCTQIKKGLNVREVRMGLALTLVVLVFIVLVIASLVQKSHETPDQALTNEIPVAEGVDFRHPFTGEALELAFGESLFVFGVMVENAYDAWPLSGVEDAFLVIEAPVEGSIPRFLAFFTSDMRVDEIGPVRSARPYYVDWAHGWDLVYAHVGGSPEALELITELGVQDLNEFYNGSTFWRSTHRSAPHNVYTSIDRLTRTAKAKDFKQRSQGFFSFKSSEGDYGDIDLVEYWWFSRSGAYDVVWNFENGLYTRSQGVNTAQSADGDLYQVNNVIFLETDIRSIDDVDRKRVRTTGEGDALLFQNGFRTEIIWKKNSIDGPLYFEDAWGNEVTLLPGKTWITVAEDLGRVTSE